MRIGRIAGQYAKPRSSSYEKLGDGRQVLSFRSVYSLTSVRPSCSFAFFLSFPSSLAPFSSIHVVPVLVSLPLVILMAMAGATTSTGTFFHCSSPPPRLSDLFLPTHPRTCPRHTSPTTTSRSQRRTPKIQNFTLTDWILTTAHRILNAY